MNQKWISAGLLVGLTIAGWACGDDSANDAATGSGGNTSSSSTTGTGTSSSGSTTGSAGGGGEGGVASPQAPIMQSVEPLTGGLHVMWENVTTDCDMIELDRNKDGGAYATAYTLTGAATSQHDSSATAPGMYCYKARCLKADQVSPDSNEKCGTP
jgi:hypothetical protein